MQTPDFKADFFSLTRVKSLLQNQGAFLLRQFLPRPLLLDWLPRFEKAVAKTELHYQQQLLSTAEYSNYYRFGHPLPALLEGYEDWINTLFAYHPLRNLLRSLYGPEAYILGAYSLPRCIQPQFPERKLNYHQDYEYIGPVQESINIWSPLTPAGGEYPGLELWLNGPQSPLFRLDQSEEERQEIIQEIPAEQIWRPEMQPGDVLIFTPYTLHRTLLTAEMTKPRISYELRLCPESQQTNTLTPLFKRQL